MEKVKEADVLEALQVIVDNRNAKALNWCVNYAREGLHMSGYELSIQCMYVLSNMSYWRGSLASKVRGTLKAFVRENS